MQEENSNPQPEHRPKSKGQDIVCNLLTFVGLVAVVLIGGSAILFGGSDEAQAEQSLPGETTSALTAGDAADDASEDARRTIPELVVEDFPVDTTSHAKTKRDSTLAADSTAHVHPTDSLGHVTDSATHAAHSAHRDKKSGATAHDSVAPHTSSHAVGTAERHAPNDSLIAH